MLDLIDFNIINKNERKNTTTPVGFVKNIRPNAEILNPQFNTLSKLNCILASVEANNLGYDEGIMDDLNGNISTCNSTNLFFIKKLLVYLNLF